MGPSQIAALNRLANQAARRFHGVDRGTVRAGGKVHAIQLAPMLGDETLDGQLLIPIPGCHIGTAGADPFTMRPADGERIGCRRPGCLEIAQAEAWADRAEPVFQQYTLLDLLA